MKDKESPPTVLILGFCNIAEGLCQVLTLGLWLGPNLSLRFLIWNLNRRVSAAERQ